MVKEIFRDVKGYEGLYQVSNLGRVKSLDYKHTGKEQILKPSSDKNGYLLVTLCKNKKGKTFRVHRLVAMTFLDNPDNLPQCNHIDENKKNNCVENIEWCTVKYNNNYGTRNERAGEKHKGLKHSETAKKKMSEAHKGKEPWCKCKHRSEETKRKISAAHKGKKHSEETRKKLSAALKGKNLKPVLQIDKKTDEVIAEFPSVSEVGQQLGFKISAISSCCTGKRKSCGGFRWRFK